MTENPAPTPPPEDSTAAPPDETTAATAEDSSPAAAAVEPAAEAAPIPEDLLQILVCPLTRSRLVQDGPWLIAQSPDGAGLRYPIRDGIPILLVDDAQLPDGVASLDEFKAKYAEHVAG